MLFDCPFAKRPAMHALIIKLVLSEQSALSGARYIATIFMRVKETPATMFRRHHNSCMSNIRICTSSLLLGYNNSLCNFKYNLLCVSSVALSHSIMPYVLCHRVGGA